MRAVVLLALLALPLVPPASASDPNAFAGSGQASTFFITGIGRIVEGGAHEATWICASCVIQLDLLAPGFTVVHDGQATSLPAGKHQITGFSGVVTADQVARFQWTLQLDGVGMHE